MDGGVGYVVLAGRLTAGEPMDLHAQGRTITPRRGDGGGGIAGAVSATGRRAGEGARGGGGRRDGTSRSDGRAVAATRSTTPRAESGTAKRGQTLLRQNARHLSDTTDHCQGVDHLSGQDRRRRGTEVPAVVRSGAYYRGGVCTRGTDAAQTGLAGDCHHLGGDGTMAGRTMADPWKAGDGSAGILGDAINRTRTLNTIVRGRAGVHCSGLQ